MLFGKLQLIDNENEEAELDSSAFHASMPNPNISKNITYCILLSFDELEQVKNLAAAGFDIVKISKVLQKDVRLFKRDWKTPGTPIHESYHSGTLAAQGLVDLKITQEAEKGNMMAMMLFKKNKEAQDLENMKEEIFNTD